MPKGGLYNQEEMRRLWGIGGMGLELAGAIILLGLIGWAVDRKLGTAPWFALAGAVIGMVGGGYNFIRRARAMTKAGNNPRKTHSAPTPPGAEAARGPDDFERMLEEERSRPSAPESDQR